MHQKPCLPIYIQIAEKLKHKISGYDWKPGTLLPTEFELADQHGVSRPTLRKALAFLEQEGYIIRKKFIGTLIAPEALRRKYRKLDIGFFTKADLTRPGAYADLFSNPLELGDLLRDTARHGHFIRLFPWQYPPPSGGHYDLTEVLLRKAVDAFVISSPMYLTDVLDMILDYRIPHVALETHYNRPGVNTVMLDDEISMREGIQLLVSLGHRKIAFLGGLLKRPEFNSQSRRFYNLFLRLAAEYGLELRDRWIQVSGEKCWRNLPVDIAAPCQAMLSDPADRPTAIVCAFGRWIPELLDVIAAFGLQVPQDISVISPLIYPNEFASDFCGHYVDFEKLSARTRKELFAWLTNPAYRAACHLVPKTFHRGWTIDTPVQNKKKGGVANVTENQAV